MTGLEEQVLRQVDALEREMIELASDLIKINTVNPYSGDEPVGSEAEAQERLRHALFSYAPEIDIFDCPPDIYQRMKVIGPKGRDFRNRPNLVATWSFDQDGRTLILNDHIDTVGVSTMSIDPFSGEIRDGRIWGRGSSDSKGCLVSAVWAAAAVSRCEKDLSGKLILESVVDEECNGSGAGTLACCDRGYRGDAAIVVDGDGLSIIHGVGGVVTADVVVHGRGGHAAQPGGVNAIDKAVFLKDAVDAFKTARAVKVPYYPVNLGVFHAGSVPAVVPGEALMSVNICYTYEEALKSKENGNEHEGQEVFDTFCGAIVNRESEDPWFLDNPSEIVWVKDLIPYEIPIDHDLVTELSKCHTAAAGRPPSVETFVAWTDASYLWNRAQTPVVLYSPGARGVAHSAVEYISIDDMRIAARAIALYAIRLLSNG